MTAQLITTFDMAMVGTFMDAVAETGLENRLVIGVAIDGDDSRGGLFCIGERDLSTFWRVHSLIKYDALYRRQKDGKRLNDSDSYMMHKAEFAAREFTLSLAIPMARREGPSRV